VLLACSLLDRLLARLIARLPALLSAPLIARMPARCLLACQPARCLLLARMPARPLLPPADIEHAKLSCPRPRPSTLRSWKCPRGGLGGHFDKVSDDTQLSFFGLDHLWVIKIFFYICVFNDLMCNCRKSSLGGVRAGSAWLVP
jgi:hypothetical protein